jgi:hypothetical protein
MKTTRTTWTKGLLQRGIAGLLIGGLVGTASIMGSDNAFAADDPEMGALEAVPTGEKAIRIRRSGGDRSDDGGDHRDYGGKDLDVSIRTERSRYHVDDPIRFQVKGNKPFFLYLFDVDPRTKRAVSILPNQRQGKDELKFPGDGRWRSVPNPGLEFYADRKGTERIVMVASERYLDSDKLLRGYGTKALGDDFYESENILDWVDAELNSAYADSEGKGLEAKAIRVRNGDGRRLPHGVVVDELNLRISR